MNITKMATMKVFMPLVLVLVITASPAVGMKEMAEEGHAMSMHHQHQMLNHALAMALQGSNLVMIGQMKMVPGVDDLAVRHGTMMMKEARAMWNETMSGSMMTKMHGAGTTPADNPVMEYTHKLAEAQVKVMDLLEKHAATQDHTMTVHHQHLLLNHALEMAIDASDMSMTGAMGMAPGIDEESVGHGKKMMGHARSLWNDVMSGDDMKKAHGEGMTPEKDAGMAFTHELAEAQLKVMDLLENMPK